jgi:phospholipid-translocating ATPase
MNVDGETNLKEKQALLDSFSEKKLVLLNGVLECDKSNENLEQWSGNLTIYKTILKPPPASIENFVLRGSIVKNIDFCFGVVVFTGMDTKIMRNYKKPEVKTSNVMMRMNKYMYSLFAFQCLIVFILASLSVSWSKEHD